MTAALGNTAQGTPYATGVDAFVYPQFIGYALRAPTSQDIYNPGTEWQDNSVNPPIIYQTTGAGVWNVDSGTSGVFTSLSVTPGSATIAGALSAGGSITSATLVTGGAGLSATTGNITASAGNLSLNGTSSKVIINASTPASASIGVTAALTTGAITVASTAVTASSIIFLSANTFGGTPGTLSAPSAAIVAGVSFNIVSSSGTDTSTVNYWIVN